MAKKKGKGKGISGEGGLDFDQKKRLEEELRATLFSAGGKNSKEPDLEVGGGSSSNQENRGSPQAGDRNADGGDGKEATPPVEPISPKGSASNSTKQSINGGGFQRSGKVEYAGRPPTFARNGKPLSFAQVARGSRRAAIAERLLFIPNIDGDCIRYSKDEVAETEKEWEATLVGAVMGPPISHRTIVEFVKSSWKVRLPRLTIKSSGILVFRFEDVVDLRWVLEHGPWSLGSSPLLLKQWVPGSPLDWGSFKSVPVWVRIPDLPPTFCSNSMLSTIGSGIGNPLCIDEFTASQDLLSFARLLIEVDVAQSRRKRVKLVNELGVECELRVIFEWLPWSCTKCNCFGHLDSLCSSVSVGKEPVQAESEVKLQGGIAKPSSIAVGVQCDDSRSCPRSCCNDNGVGVAACAAEECSCRHPVATAATRAIGVQAEKGEQIECEVQDTGHGVNDPSSQVGAEADVSREILEAGDNSSHDKSIACARMVATSWAAEMGIYANHDGELEVNECKTPDDLMRWKLRSGVMKGGYLLRGTKSRISGDVKLSLTMDELFTVMSGIKAPYCGENDAAHFENESDFEEDGDSASDDEIHPG